MIVIALILTLMLAACGSSSETSSEASSESASQAGSQEQAAVHPYAWLGLQDMPECQYLDLISTSHYVKESEIYIEGMSYVSKETNAVDGINTYKENENSKVYSIEGKVVSINDSSKTYVEQDASDISESAKENLASAMEKGTNIYGRQFKETGTGAVPVYSEQGDKTEYEYYEYEAYVYPDQKSDDNQTIERYYIKDGDVFAVYTKTTMGDTVVESTEVIKSISADIPEGMLKMPDLSGYEKQEI